KKLAVTICEDIWNMGANPLYRVTPMEKLAAFKPDIMINLSASPYNYAQDIVRNSLIKAHTVKYGIPMFYCNAVGSQTEIVFDGGSLVYDAMGNKVAEMKYFEEDHQVFDVEEIAAAAKKKGPAPDEPVYFSSSDVGTGEDTIRYLTNEKNMEEICQALI